MNIYKERTRNILRIAFVLTLLVIASSMVINKTNSQGKMPDQLVLAKDAKLGQVAFNHTKHATENRSADLSQTIACIDCHHTAQPAAEALYAADRWAEIGAAILSQTIACIDCHHTAQPAAEAAKVPLHKTAYPAD